MASKFDQRFPKDYPPLTKRGWFVVLSVTAVSIVTLLAVLSTAPSPIARALFLLSFAGVVFAVLAIYREWIIRLVNFLRSSNVGEARQFVVFVLGILAIPVGVILGLALLIR